jgi:response regulator of citrate/malate metabolism
MKALLHIQLTDAVHEVPYQTVARHIINQYPEVSSFGLDNHSSAEMLDYAREMIERISQLLVLLECYSPDAKPGRLVSLLNTLIRKNPEQIELILLGAHPLVEKMGRTLGERFHIRPDEQELQKITESLLA